MKRAGFTMIELIFVIVILGILAAVAIPRLTATRDDAKISTLAANANQVVSDMGATYTASGDLNVTGAAAWANVTNVRAPEVVYTANTATISDAAGGTACTTIVYNAANGTVTTTASDMTAASVCDGINRRIGFTAQNQTKVITISGSRVTY